MYPANDLFSLFKSMAFYSKRNVSSLPLPLSNSFSNRYLRSDGGLPVNVNVLVICLLCSGDPLILQEMEWWDHEPQVSNPTRSVTAVLVQREVKKEKKRKRI